MARRGGPDVAAGDTTSSGGAIGNDGAAGNVGTGGALGIGGSAGMGGTGDTPLSDPDAGGEGGGLSVDAGTDAGQTCTSHVIHFHIEKTPGFAGDICVLPDPYCSGSTWILDLTGAELETTPISGIGFCKECPTEAPPWMSCPIITDDLSQRADDWTWDGSYYVNGRCEGAGGERCTDRYCAAPGSYTARVCWFSGSAGCDRDVIFPETCVLVPFVLPSVTDITVAIPPKP